MRKTVCGTGSGIMLMIDMCVCVFFFVVSDACVCGWVCACLCVQTCGLLYVFLFTEAEELYQRRVLTITGICVALLVVGIICVVAYCKTKYVIEGEINQPPHL